MSTKLPRFWFGPPPELATDETWVAHYAANRSQGRRAVGGGLHLTTHRVLFSPNRIDASLGGEAWSCALTEIASLGIQPGKFALADLFSGGLRARLRINRDLFVIGSPETKLAELQSLVAAQTGSTPPSDLPEARVVER